MGRRRLALGGLMRVVAIFPGQGSQFVGMGGDLVERSSAAADVFARARDVLGYDLPAVMREGPEDRLRETRFSQPAIFTTNFALYAACEAFTPAASAGHSFGEYCSLVIAGALRFEDALSLVNERSLAMQEAADSAPGGMTAILGLDAGGVGRAVAGAGAVGRVQIANRNAPGQIVVSGDRAAVDRAAELALAEGAKRVVPLNVSGAWHSALMLPARERFAEKIAAVAIARPRFPVISNVDARPYDDPEAIRRNLVRSVTDEVLWHETAERLLAEGPDLIVEFGASAVLTSLMRRLPNVPRTLHVGDAAGVAKFAASLGSTAAVG